MSFRLRCFFILSFILQFPVFADVPRIIRGPYLQQPTPNSMIIRWRTDIATDSRVNFGTALDNLSSQMENPFITTEHSVKITGLSPFTKYFYAVGSSADGVLGGPGEKQFFKTAPLPGTEQPIRFWAIGDFGKGSQEQKTVWQSYVNYTEDTHTDLWMWLGDNAYSDGTDEEFQNKVFDSITGYHQIFKYMPFMPTPGNHDYNSICPIICGKDPLKHKGPYYDIVDVPEEGEAGGVPSHTELYYSFDYGNVHFISLNSELGSLIRPFDYTGAFTPNFTTSPMMEWLKADLAANTRPWTIAFWHQPPYCGQDVDSDVFYEVYIHAMRDNFNPVLEAAGVDLVLSGHDHCYQRTFLLNGLYGNSNTTFDSSRHIINAGSGNEDIDGPYIKYTDGPEPNKGAVYVISGNAGAGNPDGPIFHPEMWGGDACPTCIGSFVVDINGDRLDARYLKGNGEVGDHFTILKMNHPTDLNGQLSPLEHFSIYPNPVASELNVAFNTRVPGKYTLEVMDILGKTIQSKTFNFASPGQQSISVPVNKDLPAGTYLAKITGNSEVGQTTFVKR